MKCFLHATCLAQCIREIRGEEVRAVSFASWSSSSVESPKLQRCVWKGQDKDLGSLSWPCHLKLCGCEQVT